MAPTRLGRVLVGALLVLQACAPPATTSGPDTPRPDPIIPGDPTAEILWDTWGVPHIFAEEAHGLFRAFGWAQARAHGDLLLHLYGESRGRAAEYWGPDFVEQDLWLRRQDVPDRAQRWMAQQPTHVRGWLEAFVEGINAFAEANPDSLTAESRRVLPVRSVNVLAHIQRVLFFEFLASPRGVDAMAQAWSEGAIAKDPVPDRGSNGWAIGPTRSESGNALLLANPHLPWGGPFTWFEAQLQGGGLDVHGATLVGFPLPGIAFNEHLGWTHTVNTIDAVDAYELTLTANGYRWDGAERPFALREDSVRIRRDSLAYDTQRFTVRSSLHGPVIEQRQNGTALALRVAGLENTGMIDQTWRMLTATSMQEFETAISALQIPLFSIIAADAGGHILHVSGGAVPVRARGDWARWSGVLPGDSSAWLWTALHRYDEMPRLFDPGTGFVQNANEPPWTTTIPMLLRPDVYPRNMAPAPRMSLRAGNSARMLYDDLSITFDEMIRYKHSTRATAADHLLDDVLLAVRASGNDLARRAADVLQTWDRTTDADSRGAVLFEAFWQDLMRATGGNPFAVPWTPSSPLGTPDGIADPGLAVSVLTAAAARVEAKYGTLAVPWGNVHRLRGPGFDLPANGGSGSLGIFRVTEFSERDDSYSAVGGDSYVMAVEFGDTVRARTALSYGNWSQPSRHRGDQLRLYSAKELRPVLRDRFRLEANLWLRERF